MEAEARRGFLRKGRGLLVAEQTGARQFRMRYFSLAEWRRNPAPILGDDPTIQAWLAAYNGTTHYVAIIIQPAADGYRATSMLLAYGSAEAALSA